ncbi:hypothetical protein D3C79_1069070 [compost metagenome]
MKGEAAALESSVIGSEGTFLKVQGVDQAITFWQKPLMGEHQGPFAFYFFIPASTKLEAFEVLVSFLGKVQS